MTSLNWDNVWYARPIKFEKSNAVLKLYEKCMLPDKNFNFILIIGIVLIKTPKMKIDTSVEIRI